MPIQEYHCRICSRSFEVMASGRTMLVASCPDCHSAEIDRVIGLPSVARVTDAPSPTNCAGDGPPCGAPWCGRKK